MRSGDWHDSYQEIVSNIRRKEKTFFDYKHDFNSRYPIVGEKIKWDVEYLLGKLREEGDPDLIVFAIFDHIEGYSVWRKALNDTFDHQRTQTIKIRINRLNQILKCFEIDDALLKLAEIEMKPDLLEGLEILNNLLLASAK